MREAQKLRCVGMRLAACGLRLATLRTFQRRVWNQGLAPVLMLVDSHNVHIYSGLALPSRSDELVKEDGRWVDTLERATQTLAIRQSIIGIETGEFFRIHATSFDPDRRVDRRLLANLGAARQRLADSARSEPPEPRIIDALLCRLIFTCYLVDRKIIDSDYFAEVGAEGAERLLDLLAGRAPDEARRLLYALFKRLRHDFNGDLFDIAPHIEAEHVTDDHIDVLCRFLSGEDLHDGQLALGFWAYDFSVIPIEMISAIYETFLTGGDRPRAQTTGTYYTPRFLAEVVIDTALDGLPTLLNRRFLDPACGSGIFLVGLFHRIAEEWRRRHQNASYEEHVDALLHILRYQLFGVDNDQTACRIAAFSLYVALLDQLAPTTIRGLQARSRILPHLVGTVPSAHPPIGGHRTILHADFGEVDRALPADGFDVIIGNPPWVSRGRESRHLPPESRLAAAPLVKWCTARSFPIPQGQIAQAFVWKAPSHLRPGGRVCFLLPHGILFNHQPRAVAIQRQWLETYPVDRVVNLSDLRFLLFEGAIKPCVIVRYGGTTPESEWPAEIECFAPKADFGVLRAAMLFLAPEDRTVLSRRAALDALSRNALPPWKERLWGSPRDWRFIDRLVALPALASLVDQAKDRRLPKAKWKRWIAGQGFQPLGPNDDREGAKPPWPRGTQFIDADSDLLDLLLLQGDTRPASDAEGLRRRPENEDIFHRPHVIVTKGMRVAYADFDVVFQHAAQGIHGPSEDSSLLMFLAAYLCSPIAKYFFFHTSANWGAERPEVHLQELLSLPFPLPTQTASPKAAQAIVQSVATKMRRAIASTNPVFGRGEAIQQLHAELWEDIANYFSLGPSERILIEDTISMARASATPRFSKAHLIPTLRASVAGERATYLRLLCTTLNGWAKGGPSRVYGRLLRSTDAGLGIVVLSRAPTNSPPPEEAKESDAGAEVSSVLRRITAQFVAQRGSIVLGRGVKAFLGDELFILKPLQGRFWTRSAALNDADEIIAAILGPSAKPGSGPRYADDAGPA